jgi:ribonuclease HI
LWQKLLPLLARHNVRVHWLRGHEGNAENERCDILAKEAATGATVSHDTGYLNGA